MHDKSFHLLLVLLAGVVLGGVTLDAQQGLPNATSGDISRFSVPERNSKGQLIWQLMGAHAKIRPDQKMEIAELMVRTYAGTNVDWTMTSPDCVLDRATREAVSESDVKIVSSKVQISGRGFHWLANETRFIIRDNVQVVILGGVTKKDGEGASTKASSIVTADNLNYDYDKRIAVFEGHVVVVDPQMTLTCSKMIVYFDEKTNEVLRVEAFTDVHMRNEGKEAVGDKGVFTRETGVIVLSGGTPYVRDAKGDAIESLGAGIIYDINTKRMKVDKPRLKLIPAEGSNSLLEKKNNPSPASRK